MWLGVPVEGDGCKAWSRLYTRYNTRALAKSVRVHEECMYLEERKNIEILCVKK